MYKSIFRPLLYSLSPERAHYFTAGLLQLSNQTPVINSLLANYYQLKDKNLEREVFGLKFPNPVGLAAGFDKDARWIEALEMLGFGFIEIGTLTPKPQPGNPKPRLFRIEKDDALINRMGFNNHGVDDAVNRISKSGHQVPLGGNIGKNKVTANEDAVSDYVYSFQKLYDHVDYFVVNVSSPNTPGLRELQGKDELAKIFDALFEHRSQKAISKPVLLKIAPDLSDDQLDDIVKLVKSMNIDGIVATNTTLDRSKLTSSAKVIKEAGGLSGKPVATRSTAVIRAINDLSGGTIPMIGVGGIHHPEDAIEKLDAGASLVQLYTGFIYEGPGLIKNINKALLSQ